MVVVSQKITFLTSQDLPVVLLIVLEKEKRSKANTLSFTPEIPICAPSLNETKCSKQEWTGPHLKCQPSKILIGAEALQSREQNSVSTGLSGNELCFVWARPGLIEITQQCQAGP